jgi:hypothetical protein
LIELNDERAPVVEQTSRGERSLDSAPGCY